MPGFISGDTIANPFDPTPAPTPTAVDDLFADSTLPTLALKTDLPLDGPVPTFADDDGEVYEMPPRKPVTDVNDSWAINANLQQDLDKKTRQAYEPAPVAATPDEPTEKRRRLGWSAAVGVAMLRKYSANPTKRIRTGLKVIDDLLGGGIGIGEVATILGRSGSGKSLVGQNMMEANADLPILFASLEMSGTLCMLRSVAMWSGQNYRKLFDDVEAGKFDERLMAGWEQAHPQHYFTTITGITLGEMSLVLKEMEEQVGARPGLVVIDYMELLGSDGEDAIEVVTQIARQLKGWAKEEQVAVAVLHQMNTKVPHGAQPTEESARYSGFTEADIVIGVARPHKWQPPTMKLEAMTDGEREFLQGFLSVNLIKNRPRIDLLEHGYLVPISDAGRLHETPHPHELPAFGKPVPSGVAF